METNLRVAALLAEIADLLELEGAEGFKAVAYRRAARNIQALDGDVAALKAGGKLQDIPGVGPGLAGKIGELLETGTCKVLEELRGKVPAGLREVLEVPGIGTRTAAMLYREAGIASLAELEAAARAGRLQALPRLGEKQEGQILAAIARLRQRAGRIPLGAVLPYGEALARFLAGVSGVTAAAVAGSVRRRVDMVKDLDLVAGTTDPQGLVKAFSSHPLVQEVLACGTARCSVRLTAGFSADLRVVSPPEFPAALHHFTGSKEHHVRLRHLAKARGLTLSEYGAMSADGGRTVPPDEAAVYALVGLSWVPPELREDQGEIEAAAAGTLPELVSLGQVRGDLHVHTDWSDGIDTLERMARAARELGYEYLAICDHARALGFTRGLDAEKLARQGAEIDRLNAALAGITLLKGVEANILADGSLDLADEVLEGLDVVVAAVHSGLADGARVTERLSAAIRHPLVHIIAHPTGRILGRRDGTDIDLPRVLDEAARGGKVLEINAHPDRLDLPSPLARQWLDRGGLLAVDTDAHAAVALADMGWGIDVARRAWASSAGILNALPLSELRQRLAHIRRCSRQ